MSNIGPLMAAKQGCHGEYSVSGMFLKGYTFKTSRVKFPSECYMICNQDVRCQSYNVLIGRGICELNNRTKEARPDDFLHHPRRFYLKRTFSRGIIIYLWNSKITYFTFFLFCFVFFCFLFLTVLWPLCFFSTFIAKDGLPRRIEWPLLKWFSFSLLSFSWCRRFVKIHHQYWISNLTNIDSGIYFWWFVFFSAVGFNSRASC